MAIKRISIDECILTSSSCSVIDVRSPGEFLHAHFPSAQNIPLFSDEERKEVGTAYKKIGRETAIKIGLDYFGPKMKLIIEEVEKINKKGDPLIVYCWRGGMRSAGISWLLDLYGYNVHTLVGGYKSFRTWVLNQFTKKYDFSVLGGYTGSGKTEMIESIKKSGSQAIDLEKLAHHKGSAFGGIGQSKQPSQEMFENTLAIELNKSPACWLEDESQRVGSLNIPHLLWQQIRNAPLYFMDIPFEERLQYILKDYGALDVNKLIESTLRIQKRLGPLETKNTIMLLKEKNITEAFRILLQYYDKQYLKALNKRDNMEERLHRIPSNTTQPLDNTEKLFSYLKNNIHDGSNGNG